ncbi:NUCLEASE, LIPOPROTEIN [Mycoplasmopsis pulmonis]|uniref:NUCLEASE, LIPOPROTEIN n=1 Tax=Mycoplasmopsis pulmonis (strain UAB CTIP) TaxID=272635 RepID=Q98R71_MYCPU|nr:thermonuclease family protein [Mycoplasmopsis pulmonis]CAC13312.1 NUCLEASE, LIPOPROTEIN [Mycoplasmopsis pulmonis]VEU67903.1 Thermonuclease precursor [Mycoplasmopsis pulmonis]
MLKRRKIKNKWIFMLFLISSFFLIPFGLLSCKATSAQKTYTTKIVKVYDGDTFYSTNKTYRVFGIDTPELSNEKTAKIVSPIENHYGSLARSFVEKKILGQNVEVQEIKLDKYKRIVSKIFVNGQDLAKMLISEGLAKVAYISTDKKSLFYTKDSSYYHELVKLQSSSQKAKKGFWKKTKWKWINLDKKI